MTGMDDFLPSVPPPPCHLGIVFALGIESGCFEDRLRGLVTIRGNGFVAREGGLDGRRVALILSGAGRDNAARAAELLIAGHQPRRVVSAGFAGALDPRLNRHDILVADCMVDADGAEVPVDLPPELLEAACQPGVHRGRLLTVDRVVRLPAEKRAMFERFQASAVDMETIAVAEVCRRRRVAFSSIRVIGDAADEELPRDVERLLVQKTGAARLGAAVRAVCRRPSSLKDLYRLGENALASSERLAGFLAESGLR